jgi:hypothetical protein
MARHSKQSRNSFPAMVLLLPALVLPCWIIVSPRAGLGQTVPTARLPDATLAAIYRAELGSAYKESDLPALLSVQALIERFFTENSSTTGRELAKEIDGTGVPRDIVGQLCHVRMNWPLLEPGVYYINDHVGPSEIRYFLGIPRGYDVTRERPLVVKLPPANPFLAKPPPDAEQVSQIYIQWITNELTAHPDAVVLMPLLNLDELYGPGPVGMNLVMRPILNCADRVNVDPARVCLIGHSMAAHAVWNLAIHYPTYFAAINPMAGAAHDAWQRFRLSNLRNIFTVVWADASDDVIRVDESRELVRYLRRVKFDVDYDETQTVGHKPTDQIVEEDYQKVRSRVRSLYPAEVIVQSNSLDTVFNRADWLQVYQPIAAGQKIKMQFSRGSQGMYLYSNGFRAVADVVDRHTISLITKNVEVVRLYLNPQMVDLDEPIRVLSNGRVKFEGMLTPSTLEMLNDQLFLGRGWRFYTAVVDLDLGDTPATRPSGG